MTTIPTNADDIIDSRDIIARLEDLRDERDTWEPAEPPSVADLADPALAVNNRPATRWEDECPDEANELTALEALNTEGEDATSDWTYGATLIRDSYFQTYAQEFADDIGAIDRNASWPNTCIDWEQAARELQMDYTSIDFDSITYWVR